MSQSFIRLPRILITNDDGIDADGLDILSNIAKDFAEEVWIIAPLDDQSGKSESVSLTEPVKFKKREEHKFAVYGTPSDCVALAVGHIMKNNPPSLILSGINAGMNIGDEVCLSGTIGAALTGLMMGIPSIAISQKYTTRNNISWDASRSLLPKLLQHFLTEGWKKETCLSINIPDQPPSAISGFNWGRQSKKNIAGFNVEMRTNPRGQEYAWISLARKTAEEESDSEYSILKRGRISVTALSLDRSVEVLKPPIKFDETEKPSEKNE